MKRPPEIWLIGIGILCAWLIPNTSSLRATSLIFSKTSSTTSTTSTTETPSEDEVTTLSTEGKTDANQTATKPPLTGIPQIDYIWDPNLPFELRGYNLSDYPFYDRVPDEIDFKCDGLHDGFYASVPHKCQVYHHCLFGTRYDFLCANFTAFDQKTFICHFVSEVDCNNSPKYWHRNDALYKAATTTTPSTTTVQAVITPSPALNPALRRPSPTLRRRRPYRRRRPQYDYYYDEIDDYDLERDRERSRDRDRDDYYDEPPVRSGSRRRNRPRPRRPEYDEYDDYEEDRYERRPGGRRDEDRNRRPYDRRDEDRRYDDRRSNGSSKNKDRRTDDEDDRRKTDERRRGNDDRRADDDYDRRPYNRRKPAGGDRYEDDEKDDRRTYDQPRKTEDDKNDRRTYDRPRKQEEERRYRPKEQKQDDKDERRYNDRPRKTEEDNRRFRPREKAEDRPRTTEESKVLIKPSSGSSVYDRPRAPPIIRRPVPITEREKYEYKPNASKTATKEESEEEYYEDYEEESKVPPPKPTRKTIVDSRETEERRGSYLRPRRPQNASRRPLDDEEDIKRPTSKRPQERIQEKSRYTSERITPTTKKQPEDEEEYADEYEEDKPSLKGESSRERERPKLPPKAETATRENSKEREHRPEPVIKIVKRPFLPSRGGNPYAARGLQPVGAKAIEATSEAPKTVEPTTRPTEKTEPNKSSVYKSEEEIYYDDEEDDLKPITKRPQGDFRLSPPRTTQKPKVPDNFRNPLDINENEYDVTLNDALNPTLPNLPVRSVPTGFSSGREGYIAQNYQRPRLVAVENPVLTQASSDYIYRVKQPQNVQNARSNPYVQVQDLLNFRQPAARTPFYTTYN